jgi:hypothetical protein
MADRTYRTHRTHNTPRRLTLGEFVRRELPHLDIASISQPEPELARHNVVAATDDIEAARSAVLELEALEADDAKLGFVTLSTAGGADVVDGRADPEGFTGMVASRTLVGGALGAIGGALLIGGVTALLVGGSTALVAAIGGALIGGVFGATWVVFAGMGGSDAYRQSFIAPEVTDVCIVSLHTDDAAEAADGHNRLAGSQWLTIVEVDANGMMRSMR